MYPNSYAQTIVTTCRLRPYGEAINLINNFKVEKVIFNCREFNELEQDLINVLDKKKIPYYSCIKELNIDDNKLYFLNHDDYDHMDKTNNLVEIIRI